MQTSVQSRWQAGMQAGSTRSDSPAFRPHSIIAFPELRCGRNSFTWSEIPMETHAAMLQAQQPTSSASAAAGHYSFRAGVIRTDRESLAELERKLMEARQQFQDLKEEKCNLASSKGCGCGCCPHGGYVQAQKATSVGPDSRSVSETSNQLPVKRSGRQSRSNVGNIPGASRQRRSLRINGIPPPRTINILDV